VLSHLGSQSEIALAALPALLSGDEQPGQELNESVWARWDGSDNRTKATQFVEHSAALLAALEDVTDKEVLVRLSFLPAPLPFATVLGMRLNEFALHGWDIAQALDGSAALHADDAHVLAEHLSDGMGFLLGFTTKPDQLPEPAVVGAGDLRIVIDDAVSIDPGATATATLDAPAEAGIRLINGRLHEDVPVTGDVSLAQLRAVFPGY
jgi:uncharacterized protein (TIGR03083 family)